MNLSPEQKDAVAAGAKLAGAWTSVGAARAAELASYAQAIASIAAAIFTVLLICEFVWKKALRPLCEWRGWLKRKRRRHDDVDSGPAPLGSR